MSKWLCLIDTQHKHHKIPSPYLLLDMYLYIKALHLIFVVTWFSGLFYVVRLFIYQREAHDKSEPERSFLQAQFDIMIKRLWYGIAWPSMVLVLVFGLSLLSLYGWSSWLFWKMIFLAGLVAYHLSLHDVFRKQKRRIFRYTSTQLRIWNEVASIFLVAIIFIAVLKNTLSVLYGLLGLVLFTLLLLFAIWVYKRLRMLSETNKK